MFSELHTQPGYTPVNASSCRLPDTTHHSGPRRLARSYFARLFHSLLSSGFAPTHPGPFLQHLFRNFCEEGVGDAGGDHRLSHLLCLIHHPYLCEFAVNRDRRQAEAQSPIRYAERIL